MMQLLTTGWSWIRIIRLVLGIGALVQGIPARNHILIVMGGLLLVQGLFNMGCGPAGCATTPTAKQADADGEVVFEEVTERK